MKKQSLVDRILAFLEGGDKAKLSRFESKLNKYFDAQIKMRKESIEKVRERITDATDGLGEAITTVDASAIGTTDSADVYVSQYVKGISEKVKSIEAFELSIEIHEKEIAHFEKLRSVIYPEVAE